MIVDLGVLAYMAIFAGIGLAVGFWGARATKPAAPRIRSDLPARHLRLRGEP